MSIYKKLIRVSFKFLCFLFILSLLGCKHFPTRSDQKTLDIEMPKREIRDDDEGSLRSFFTGRKQIKYIIKNIFYEKEILIKKESDNTFKTKYITDTDYSSKIGLPFRYFYTIELIPVKDKATVVAVRTFTEIRLKGVYIKDYSFERQRELEDIFLGNISAKLRGVY